MLKLNGRAADPSTTQPHTTVSVHVVAVPSTGCWARDQRTYALLHLVLAASGSTSGTATSAALDVSAMAASAAQPRAAAVALAGDTTPRTLVGTAAQAAVLSFFYMREASHLRLVSPQFDGCCCGPPRPRSVHAAAAAPC